MIEFSGALAKMPVVHDDTVQYHLPLGDSLVHLNPHLGNTITLTFLGEINCIHCKKKTKKSFSQGYCYPCFKRLARCDQCIIKPELCHYHEGTCREPQWGEQHCMKPHIIYLANSSGLKVGITRQTQEPTRWIDQGAIQAIPLFKVGKRLDSGAIEVALKQFVSDKTNWRKMLKNDVCTQDMVQARDQLLDKSEQILKPVLEQISDYEPMVDSDTLAFNYPVIRYPEKVSSLSFDKQSVISGTLMGIKGQYLLLSTGVLNIRKFSGYHVEVRIEGEGDV